jgi:ATP phosphoribosyltransferase-like protein
MEQGAYRQKPIGRIPVSLNSKGCAMDQNSFRQRLQQLHIDTEPGEEVFEIIHKHWGRIIPSFIGLGTLAVLTLIVIGISVVLGTFSSSDVPFFAFVVIWYLALGAYGAAEWRSHNLSALVVTNKRILDIEQTNMFSRRVQGSDIHLLQSCTAQVDAGLGSIFNYGNVWINTLGDAPYTVSHLPLPELVSSEILRYHNLMAHGENGVQLNGNGHAETEAEAVLEAVEATPVSKELEPFIERTTPEALQQSETEHPTQAVAYAPQFYEGLKETDLKPLPKPRIVRRTLTLLMFHLPSENLDDILAFIPSQKEPTVTYLQNSDCYEIEVIIPSNLVTTTVAQAKSVGAHNFVCSSVEIIE